MSATSPMDGAPTAGSASASVRTPHARTASAAVCRSCVPSSWSFTTDATQRLARSNPGGRRRRLCVTNELDSPHSRAILGLRRPAQIPRWTAQRSASATARFGRSGSALIATRATDGTLDLEVDVFVPSPRRIAAVLGHADLPRHGVTIRDGAVPELASRRTKVQRCPAARRRCRRRYLAPARLCDAVRIGRDLPYSATDADSRTCVSKGTRSRPWMACWTRPERAAKYRSGGRSARRHPASDPPSPAAPRIRGLHRGGGRRRPDRAAAPGPRRARDDPDLPRAALHRASSARGPGLALPAIRQFDPLQTQ